MKTYIKPSLQVYEIETQATLSDSVTSEYPQAQNNAPGVEYIDD